MLKLLRPECKKPHNIECHMAFSLHRMKAQIS